MIGVCAHCGEETKVFPQRGTKVPLCTWCQRKARPLQRCSVCGHDRPDVYLNQQTQQLTCTKCYKRTNQPRPPCSRCHHPRIVAYRDEHDQPICAQCARRGKYKEKCSICGQKRMVTARTDADEPICSLCHQTYQRLIVCIDCGLTKPMGKKLGPDQYRCHGCHERSKKGICPTCGHERTLSNKVNGVAVCRMCKWDSKRGICKKCQRDRPLHIDGYCGGCYGAVRRQRSIDRISAMFIGMVVYNTKTTERGRIRGIRTPLNKRRKPDVLRTELLIDLIGRRPEEELFWPAIRCRSLKHRTRERLADTPPIEQPEISDAT